MASSSGARRARPYDLGMVSERSAEDVLASLAPEERAAIETFCRRVVDEFGSRVRDIRLYGSKATGQDRPDSDIDLLVLLDGDDWQSEARISAVARDVHPFLSVIVKDYGAHHAPASRASLFYKELRRTSVKLLAHIGAHTTR